MMSGQGAQCNNRDVAISRNCRFTVVNYSCGRGREYDNTGHNDCKCYQSRIWPLQATGFCIFAQIFFSTCFKKTLILLPLTLLLNTEHIQFCRITEKEEEEKKIVM